MSALTPMRVLANATEFIELLADDGALQLADVAARLDVPRSSVYRLCEGLVSVGMVEVLPESRVRLTSRWLGLADAARDGMSEWRAAGGVLAQIVERTAQTAFLSVPYESSALCLDWQQGRAIDVLAYRPGRSLPLNAGAAGRTLTAYGLPLPDGELVRLTSKTITDRDELAADSDLIRQRGYALSAEDVTLGIGAVGVPILEPNGSIRAVLSVGGLVEEIQERCDELVAELRSGVVALNVEVQESK